MPWFSLNNNNNNNNNNEKDIYCSSLSEIMKPLIMAVPTTVTC